MKHTITEITDSVIYSTRHRRAENQDQAFELMVTERPGVTGGMWMGVCVDGTSDSDGKQAARLGVRTAYAWAGRLLARLPELYDAVDCVAAGDYPAAQAAVERIIFPALREMVLAADKVLAAQPCCAATFSAAVIYDGMVYAANVGDSPIWLLYPDESGRWQKQCLYTCHNAAGRLEREGEVSGDPRNANTLLRWIGHRSGFDTDCVAITAQPLAGDNILLMGSDGALDRNLDDATVELISGCETMQQLCGQLLCRKKSDPQATDNFTLIAARIFVSES